VVRKGFYPFSVFLPLPKTSFEALEFGVFKYISDYLKLWSEHMKLTFIQPFIIIEKLYVLPVN